MVHVAIWYGLSLFVVIYGIFSPLVKVLAKSALQVKGLGIGLSIWFRVAIWYILGPESRYMGTASSTKYILYLPHHKP